MTINSDLDTIERLTRELDTGSLTDSISSIVYKSNISQLLEKTLFEDAKTDLQELIDKYEPFINSSDLPENSPIRTIIDRAGAEILAVDAKNAIASTEPAAPAAPASEPAAAEPAQPASEFDINWEQVVVAPPQQQTDTAIIVLKHNESNSIFIVEASYYEQNTIPIATGIDPTDFTNVTVPDSLLDKIDAEMNRRDAAAAPAAPASEPAAAEPAAEPAAAEPTAPAPTFNAAQAAQKGRQLHNILNSGFLGYTNAQKQQQILTLIRSIRSRAEFDAVDAAFRSASRNNETILGWLSTEQWNTGPIRQHIQSLGAN